MRYLGISLLLISTFIFSACTTVPQVPATSATPVATSTSPSTQIDSDDDKPMCASCTADDSGNCDYNEICAFGAGRPDGVCVPEPSPNQKYTTDDINSLCGTNYREQGQ